MLGIARSGGPISAEMLAEGPVTLVASAGRGYLAPLGRAFFIFVVVRTISLLDWGGWLPWSVPVLLSGMFGPQGAAQVGLHSYGLVLLAPTVGSAGTFAWWRHADQSSQARPPY